jgi:hypothetical protein
LPVGKLHEAFGESSDVSQSVRPEKRRSVMTARAATAKSRPGDTLVDRLREELGVRGVLVQMANAGRSSSSDVKCRAATATKAGPTSTPSRTLPALGNCRQIITRGSSPMADTSTLGTSGSHMCFATERTMPGACGLEGCSRRGCRWTRSPRS